LNISEVSGVDDQIYCGEGINYLLGEIFKLVYVSVSKYNYPHSYLLVVKDSEMLLTDGSGM
jgi:hypothetical protein